MTSWLGESLKNVKAVFKLAELAHMSTYLLLVGSGTGLQPMLH